MYRSELILMLDTYKDEYYQRFFACKEYIANASTLNPFCLNKFTVSKGTCGLRIVPSTIILYLFCFFYKLFCKNVRENLCIF